MSESERKIKMPLFDLLRSNLQQNQNTQPAASRPLQNLLNRRPLLTQPVQPAALSQPVVQSTPATPDFLTTLRQRANEGSLFPVRSAAAAALLSPVDSVRKKLAEDKAKESTSGTVNINE